MNFQDKDIAQIEAWLEGKLQATELAQFEERLQNDSAFKIKVDEYSKLIKTLQRHSTHEAFRSKLNEAEVSLALQATPKRISTVWLPIAASLLLVCSIALGLYLYDYSHQQERKYVQMRNDVVKLRKEQNLLQSLLNEYENERKLPQTQATGFAVSSNGYVFSSAHVLKGHKKIKLENEKYGELNAIVVATDEKLDLCLLKIIDSSFTRFNTVISIRNTKARIAEKVFTLGYPKKDIVYGEGVISSLSGYNSDSLSLQISIPVNPGNSGSPVLDEQGMLLGIIEGKQDESEGTSFALKNSYIIHFIQTVQEKEKLRYQLTPIISGGRSSIAEKMSSSVFRVIVY